MDRLQAIRRFYAELVTANGNTADARIIGAFAAVPREVFAGPGPWQVWSNGRIIATPSDDPVFLYQDVLISLAADRGINNGEPSLHARSIAALAPRDGDTVVHVGAGTGYYTAILAELVGPAGQVTGIEIQRDLARRAEANLADRPNVRIEARSGTEGTLPPCDCLYVSAGATHPPSLWLDALKPGGRLVFPLTPNRARGAMLCVTRAEGPVWPARFIGFAGFIACIGARDDVMSDRLAKAFAGSNMWRVRSLHRKGAPDQSAWCAGDGWWLSTAEPGSGPAVAPALASG